MLTTQEAGNDTRQPLGRVLRLLLADEYRLYKLTHDYHWNVTGPDADALRLLFQLQHEEVSSSVDRIAAWIRAINYGAPINWTELRESARCAITSGRGLVAERMLAELLRSHEEIIAQLRIDSRLCLDDLRDSTMAVLLTGLRERHENAAWMVRAQLGATWEKWLSEPRSA